MLTSLLIFGSAVYTTLCIYITALSTTYVVILSFCCVMTILSILSYLESVSFLIRNLGNWKPRDKAIWILGLYPVICTTSFIGLLIPRSATLNDMVAAIYLSICVYLFVVMLMGHFGGQHRMSRKLAKKTIEMQSPPLCCCCPFCPTLEVTTFRLRVLELLVLQFAIIRPLLYYLAAVMWSDQRYEAEDLDADSTYTWITVINAISAFIAVYGFVMVYKVSKIPLQKMCIKPKFLTLQIVILISTYQHLVISIFVVTGVITCDSSLTAKANGDRWNHIVLITEIFTISWFARNFYRRHIGDVPLEEIPETPSDAGSTLTRQRQGARRVNENDRVTYGSTTDYENDSLPQEVPSVSSHVSPSGSSEDSVKNQLEDIFGPGLADAKGPLSVVKTSVIDVDVMIDNGGNHNEPLKDVMPATPGSEVAKALGAKDVNVTIMHSGNESFI